MKFVDREPTRPGRVKITPESNGDPFYATLTRADEATVAGTPLTAATLQAVFDRATKADRIVVATGESVGDAIDSHIHGWADGSYGYVLIKDWNFDTNGNDIFACVRKYAANYVFVDGVNIMYGYRVSITKMWGTWYPWEYTTPPMADGVEYRTTERALGAVVFTKTLVVGALPQNGSKSIAHNIERFGRLISIQGTVTNAAGTEFYDITALPDVISSLSVSHNNFWIATSTASDFKNCHVTLKYTKTAATNAEV